MIQLTYMISMTLMFFYISESSSGSNTPTIMVAGGKDPQSQYSVEYIDLSTYHWLVGPSLPSQGSIL